MAAEAALGTAPEVVGEPDGGDGGRPPGHGARRRPSRRPGAAGRGGSPPAARRRGAASRSWRPRCAKPREVAAGCAMAERQLDLADGHSRARTASIVIRVSQPNPAASGKHALARGRREEALTRERLGGVEAAAQADRARARALFAIPKPPPSRSLEARDGEIGAELGRAARGLPRGRRRTEAAVPGRAPARRASAPGPCPAAGAARRARLPPRRRRPSRRASRRRRPRSRRPETRARAPARSPRSAPPRRARRRGP